MGSVFGKVYRCLPSFRSHNIPCPSLPPEAQSDPSGETVTETNYSKDFKLKFVIAQAKRTRKVTSKKALIYTRATVELLFKVSQTLSYDNKLLQQDN